MYVICDSINGFCLIIIPHIGDKKFEVKEIVINLAKNLIPNDYLYMDRYYCSIDLFIHLYKKGIRATGTILANRKNMPKNIISNLNLKLHETFLYKYEDIIHLIFWKDKKIIYIIYKYYDGQIINTLRLNKKTMKKENINKPYLIEQYTRFMKGVDLMDQYLCLYMNKHRSLKWYKK